MPRSKTTPSAQLSTAAIIAELERRRDEITAIIDRFRAVSDAPTSVSPAKTITKASPVSSRASEAPKTARRGPKGSAVSFVLSLLKEKPLSTAEINTLWKRTRKGVSDNYLTSLTKAGQIKRSPNPSGRGSQYSLA